MSYEIHTFDVVPGSLLFAEKHLMEALESAGESRYLVAAWRTEIGPLNQVIHIYGRESAVNASKQQIRAREILWTSAASSEHIVECKARLMAPLAFSPPPGLGECGPYYEIRSYQFRADDFPEIERGWAARIEDRVRSSPVWAVWRSIDDGPSTLVHIWPYRSLDQRAEVRRLVGGWSRTDIPRGAPRGNYRFLRQETVVAVPTHYSPAQ